MKTKVIFRKFKNGDVIALFPQMAGTNKTWTCSSYMQIGQHGAADVNLTQSTKLAKPNEYKTLLSELKRIGYKNIVIGKRFSKYDDLLRAKEIVAQK